MRGFVGDLSSQAKEVNGITYISAEFTGDPKHFVKKRIDLDPNWAAVVVLGSKTKGVKLIVAVTKDLVGRTCGQSHQRNCS